MTPVTALSTGPLLLLLLRWSARSGARGTRPGSQWGKWGKWGSDPCGRMGVFQAVTFQVVFQAVTK